MVELQTAVDEMNKRLGREKSRLESSLTTLEATRSQLQQQAGVNAERSVVIQGLEQKLAKQEASLAQQRSTIDALDVRVAAGRSALERDQQRVGDRDKRFHTSLAVRDERIDRLQQRLVLLRSQLTQQGDASQRVVHLEADLNQRQARISEQQEELEQLKAEIEKRTHSVESPTAPAVALTRAVGPEIEIIDPPLSAVRGAPRILLRNSIEDLELIGKVKAGAGLFSFRINNDPSSLEANGLFRTDVSVRHPETPVNMVAIDRQGNRTSLDFLIVPAEKKGRVQSVDKPLVTRAAHPSGIDFGQFHALIIGNTDLPNSTPNGPFFWTLTSQNSERRIAHLNAQPLSARDLRAEPGEFTA